MADYPIGMWHRFEQRKKDRPYFFEIALQDTTIYYRLGLIGTKTATKSVRFNSRAKAELDYSSRLTEKLQEGFSFISSKI